MNLAKCRRSYRTMLLVFMYFCVSVISFCSNLEKGLMYIVGWRFLPESQVLDIRVEKKVLMA